MYSDLEGEIKPFPRDAAAPRPSGAELPALADEKGR